MNSNVSDSRVDAFFSYAGDDQQIANEIVGALKSRGLSIWYAPLDLRVGEKLLDSIEYGMKKAPAGILLISKKYLEKSWTNYEMDVLLRLHVEAGKMILPVWLGVSKKDVEDRHPGLAGIVCLEAKLGLQVITNKLVEALSAYAPMIGVIPSWESPEWRFLKGRGEVHIGSEDGPVTTLWEIIVYHGDEDFPLFLGGQLYSRGDLIYRAAQMLTALSPEEKSRFRQGLLDKVWDICEDAGFDPNLYF